MSFFFSVRIQLEFVGPLRREDAEGRHAERWIARPQQAAPFEHLIHPNIISDSQYSCGICQELVITG